MAEVVVTRNHQVTLTKDVRERLGIREGDRVTINTLGDVAIVTKRDPGVWRDGERFLPDTFHAILERNRQDPRERLEDLGLV